MDTLFPLAFRVVGGLTVGLSAIVVGCHIWNRLRTEPEDEIIGPGFIIGWSYAMIGLFSFAAIFWDK